MVKLLTPAEGEEVSLLTDFQHRMIAEYHKMENKPLDYMGWKPAYHEHRSSPAKVKLTFECDSYPVTVKLYEGENLVECYTADRGEAEFVNLKVNRIYFWQVEDSPKRSFRTADESPRLIDLPGLMNIRDIGGIKTTDGRHIKQGLIYRGCALDMQFNPPDSTLAYMRDRLGIKTDMDIRFENKESPKRRYIGAPTEYLPVPIYCGYNYFTEFALKSFTRSVFEILADPGRYPIYCHCMHGFDRTGTLMYLLEGALGVSFEEAYVDFWLSTLNGFDFCPYFYTLPNIIKTYGPPDASLEECVHAFFRVCGFDGDFVERLKNLLLE